MNPTLTLIESRNKVTEALTLLKQGNPHMAEQVLLPLLHEGGSVADAAALAVNWISLGLPHMALTPLQGYLRKTAFEELTTDIRKEIRSV